MFLKKYKMRLIAIQCLLILLVNCNLASSAPSPSNTQEVISNNNGKNIDSFKNKEILSKNIIPDILVYLANLSEKKFESLYRLLSAWDNLHDEQLKLSKGESYLFTFQKKKKLLYLITKMLQLVI